MMMMMKKMRLQKREREKNKDFIRHILICFKSTQPLPKHFTAVYSEVVITSITIAVCMSHKKVISRN